MTRRMRLRRLMRPGSLDENSGLINKVLVPTILQPNLDPRGVSLPEPPCWPPGKARCSRMEHWTHFPERTVGPPCSFMMDNDVRFRVCSHRSF